MKRIVCTILALGLVWGCQKQAEQEPAAQTENSTPQSREQRIAEALDEAKSQMPPSPKHRFSEDSKIWLTSAEGKPGEQVKIDINYYISEPSKTIVVPLTFLGNVVIDSFSWVGSDLANYGMKPVNIRNDLRVFLAAVVPTTEPDIPVDTGFYGSIYFSIEKDAQPQTVVIETTFIHPGNTLMYIDTLIGGVTPQWEAGSIKVIK